MKKIIFVVIAMITFSAPLAWAGCEGSGCSEHNPDKPGTGAYSSGI